MSPSGLSSHCSSLPTNEESTVSSSVSLPTNEDGSSTTGSVFFNNFTDDEDNRESIYAEWPETKFSVSAAPVPSSRYSFRSICSIM